MSEYGICHPDQVWLFTPRQAEMLGEAIAKRKQGEIRLLASALRTAAWAGDEDFSRFIGDFEGAEETEREIPGIEHRKK